MFQFNEPIQRASESDSKGKICMNRKLFKLKNVWELSRITLFFRVFTVSLIVSDFFDPINSFSAKAKSGASRIAIYLNIAVDSFSIVAISQNYF